MSKISTWNDMALAVEDLRAERNRLQSELEDALSRAAALETTLIGAHDQRDSALAQVAALRAALQSVRKEICNIQDRVDRGARENAMHLVGLALTTIDRNLANLPAASSVTLEIQLPRRILGCGRLNTGSTPSSSTETSGIEPPPD